MKSRSPMSYGLSPAEPSPAERSALPCWVTPSARWKPCSTRLRLANMHAAGSMYTKIGKSIHNMCVILLTIVVHSCCCCCI